ncbi:MAG: DUF3501 family protein [Myxococcota bacterium]|nr:DUF3501 family protein [Myxococcota bacterium]
MKSIEPAEILGLADYETVRERFRARIIAEKRHRRVMLGPNASVVVENRDTVLLQIQEMLRTERITRPAAVQHEIDTYNELVPGPDELSCTLMIEIADKAERDAFLQRAKGLENHIWFVVGGLRFAARSSERWTDACADRTTAVHYLKFSLSTQIADTIRGANDDRPETLGVRLEIDHPAYAVGVALRDTVIQAIREDLLA